MRLLHHGTSKYRSGGFVGPACWPHFDLLVVLGGSFHFDLPDGLTASAGDALIAPPGVRFRGQASGQGGTLWVHHFRPGSSKNEAWLRRLSGARIAHYPGATQGIWAQALLTRIHEIHPHAAQKEEQGQLLKMLLRLTHGSLSSQKPSAVQESLRDAEDRGWKGVSTGWMAQCAGLSSSHFRARFAAEMGASVGDFLRTRRLEHAREALESSDAPIKEISRNAGYSEMSAFYHAFRKAVGCSPAKYRKRHPGVV